MSFLILADCRCGGNAIRSALGNHPDLTVGEELLNPVSPDFVFPRDLPGWITRTFDHYDGFHLQRYQLPECHDVWRQLLVPDLRVIDLRRDDLVQQYKSWKLASTTDRWLERDDHCPLPTIKWDQDEYFSVTDSWIRGRKFTDEILADVPMLRIEYQEIDRHFQHTIDRILKFLGLNPMRLEPSFPKPIPIEYEHVFT